MTKKHEIEEARERALAHIKTAQKSGDPESAHGDADDALCDLLIALGHKDVVEEWEKVEKWYA